MIKMKLSDNIYSYYSLENNLNTDPLREEERIKSELIKHKFNPSENNVKAFIDLNNFLLKDFNQDFSQKEKIIKMIKKSNQDVGGLFPLDFIYIEQIRDFIMEYFIFFKVGQLTLQIISKIIHERKERAKKSKIDEYLLDIANHEERLNKLEKLISKLEKKKEEE